VTAPRAPRLVASDLDGTLVRSDGTVSARSRAALARVRDAGAAIVVVTGRPPRWMHMVAEQTGHTGIALVANGAAVYDLTSEALLRTDPMLPDAAQEVIARIRTVVSDVRFAGETGGTFFREKDYRSDFGDHDQTRIVDAAGVASEPLLKLLARTSSLDADALLAAAQAVVGPDLATLTHSSTVGLLEMSAAGVSKASALARTADELGIAPADAVAFGDMPNDLPMLAWAGRSYAVANAHPTVLGAAGAVVASHDDDGVAEMLEKLFPGA
jgi:Cof subfamily protein (haloacid dehalogenase superfamily)